MPDFDAKVRRLDSGALQIYDQLRQKYVALTPEEWVRQHFVDFLLRQRGYPASRMANEVGIRHNGRLRRCDTIVYDRHALPLAIIEYKASEVEITETVFDQIVRYNMVLRVPWLMVSNGRMHYCCRIEGDKYAFKHDIPTYEVIEKEKNE